ASPVLTHWKEREAAYRSRRARITRELGYVPAYATTEAGAPEDVEPRPKRRRTRRGSLIAPEEPGQQISRDEFQELVRDLDVEQAPGGSDRGAAGTRVARRPVVAEPDAAAGGQAAVAEPGPVAGGHAADEAAHGRDPEADLAPAAQGPKAPPKAS